jgi:hypothetical protein
MKNRIKALFLPLLFAGSVMAQTTTRIGWHEAVQWNPATSTSSFSSISDVKEIAQQIIKRGGRNLWRQAICSLQSQLHQTTGKIFRHQMGRH